MSTNINGDTGVSKIQDNTIVTADLQDDAVTTVKILDANVTTDKIADDAVTLAKMASGTDGNIISYDTSGNPVAVATGSSGQVLTSAGAGAVPTFATLSSGGVSLLGTLTTTSGTTQTLAVDHTAYNQLIFVFEQVELTGTSGIIQVGVAGLARMNINDVNTTSTTCIIGPVYFDLNANVYWEENQVAAAVIASGNQFHGGSFQGMGQYQVDQNLRASASANVSFSYSSGASFDGGKIYIYGLK